jgi:hypothetical protein
VLIRRGDVLKSRMLSPSGGRDPVLDNWTVVGSEPRKAPGG